MPLTTRLLLFFLGTLACVLAGFSASLFVLVRAHLHRHADASARAALDTLTAATEIDNKGLEWEGRKRQLRLPTDRAGQPLPWIVLGQHGRREDGSPDTEGGAALFAARTREPAPGVEVVEEVVYEGQSWRIFQRVLRAPPMKTKKEKPEEDDTDPRHDVLVFAVGLPLRPIIGELRTLAVALAGISLALWLSAAVAGRWLCRRALAPLTRMAEAARGIHADALGQRLPVPATHDELEGLGKSFNDLLGRLQESFERQRRFTGDASHQLRTPLTAMLGQIEVALRRDRDGEEYRRVLGAVRRQAGQLRQIVEMLLFLARADGESVLPDREEIDLAAWLADHLRGWEDHPRAADFHLEAPSPSCSALVHPPLLAQLVDNLLDNACKYSPAGTEIRLRVSAPGESVCLEVADQGPGIAAGEIPHIFEPFYRSKQARAGGSRGIGLGLAVARRIALAFGGRLEVESAPGQGSRFTLRLPKASGGTTVGVRPL
jgi:heavy metal sensor kinase